MLDSLYWNGTSSRSEIKNVVNTCSSTSEIHNVPCTRVNEEYHLVLYISISTAMVKNTYLDQMNNNRITVDGMIYMLSPVDLENLNPATSG